MPTLYLSLVVAFLLIAGACHVAERKSRRWYLDQALLRVAHWFEALAAVAVGFFVYSII